MTRTHSIKIACRSCGTMTYEHRERLYVPRTAYEDWKYEAGFETIAERVEHDTLNRNKQVHRF